MVTVAKLEAILNAQTGQFDKAMDRSHNKMGAVGKVAGVMGAAIFAGLAVTAKRGFDELADSQLVMAQTEAVLKSTGGTAHVTAASISNLAGSLSRLTGIDDEVIQAGENMLLTFTNIHNEAGRGNDIFNQSTRILADMSVALGTDMNKSAIQLGKALNDPIKGITALQRVGVTFTDAQRKQIAALVASGHTLKAQKVILRELNKEFGGSAEAAGNTLPGQLAKMRNAFDNVSANLVAKMLPALTSVLEKVSQFVDFLGSHPNFAAAFAAGLFAVASGFLAISFASAAATLALSPWIAAVAGIAFAIAGLAAGLVIAYNKSETFRAAVNFLWGVLKAVGSWIGEWLPKIGRWIADGFNSKDVGHIKDVLSGFWGIIKGVAAWLGEWAPKIAKFIADAFKSGPLGTFLGALKDIWDWLIKITSKVWKVVVDIDWPDAPGGGLVQRISGGKARYGKKKADGGPVMGGSSYIVGERGPEWFVPQSSGTIIPNGGGARVIHNHHYNGPVVQDAKFLAYLQELDAKFQRRNGRPAFGT